ncbi:MAG: ATP-binding protein [Phycisphaerales bacterium]|nr:ATP-binding protein [Phycisphaerales bacterium]
MTTPVEHAGHRTVGTIACVAPNEFTVMLDTDAPASTALNAGYPAPFPRINGYVLVPNEVGSIVCLIAWLGIENAPYPKRLGLKDFGLVDLPYPVRKMKVLPVATLRRIDTDDATWEVERGVRLFPTVGDAVLLPTREELRHIVEGRGVDARVQIGTAPLAGNARIAVDPDKLFGRHLAVLGNTGSGKSCSVAGVIRWSLEAAAVERELQGRPKLPNARFIVLDPNGEYSRTFADAACPTRLFRVEPEAGVSEALVVPAWLWNTEEWTSFSRAQPGAQRPLLIQALRGLRAGAALMVPATRQVRRFVVGHRLAFAQWQAAGASTMQFAEKIGCGKRLEVMEVDLQALIQASGLEQGVTDALTDLKASVTAIYGKRSSLSKGVRYFNDFADADLVELIGKLDKISGFLPQQDESKGENADRPLPFDADHLPDYLEAVAGQEGGAGAQFVPYLCIRLRTMLSDPLLRSVVNPAGAVTLAGWLKDLLADGAAGQVSVIDLSLVPSDVLHVVIAVLARATFEALQRHRRITKQALPTVLVLEEAHTFVHRARSEEESLSSPEHMCRRTFERIAREGRKFGLGLLVSSQRPSELSPTVLAQCNTFLLHRIVNDRDQELVQRLVPDNLGGLLSELPTLPTRHAILLGWATPVPVLVEMRDLPKDHRPDAGDPGFWQKWCEPDDPQFTWQPVADAWQGIEPNGNTCQDTDSEPTPDAP